ncbi:hypothetical protein ACFV5G_07700 [Streptomyces sp. NPDC059766]|uniref:hypothetical protein n=1 Tax=Streptomyces sp. NPDC059766 TaxID=3346940 RepID=UPI0036689C6C
MTVGEDFELLWFGWKSAHPRAVVDGVPVESPLAGNFEYLFEAIQLWMLAAVGS